MTADLRPAELATALAAVDPDVIQLSGNESADALDPAANLEDDPRRLTGAAFEEAKLWMAAGCERILLDAAHADDARRHGPVGGPRDRR